jgi:hypothetical protein
MTRDGATLVLRLGAIACAVLVFALSRGGARRAVSVVALAPDAKPFDQRQKNAVRRRRAEGSRGERLGNLSDDQR